MMNVKEISGDFNRLSMRAAHGSATYHINRGTFHTSDHIEKWYKLQFETLEDGVYWYKANKQRIGVVPQVTDEHVELKIINESTFNRFEFLTTAEPTEHIYGCGEQFSSFDLKGRKIAIWVSEHHSLKKIIKKFLREKLFGVNPNHRESWKDQQTYYAQPTYMSSRGYAFHGDSDAYQVFDFRRTNIIHRFRNIPTSLHFFMQSDFLKLSGQLTNWFGIQHKLPAWVQNGAIIASQGGTDALWHHLKQAENHNIPITGVWSQDWSGNLVTAFGYQVYWNWQASPTLYPLLKETIKKLSDQNIAFLGYINTFLKVDTPLYLEARDLGYFVRNKKDETYLIKSTTFEAGIVDLTNPKAFIWYKNVIKTEMIDIGMKGWMADFGEYLPTDAKIYQGDPELAHNQWPVLWAKLNHEAIVESGKLDEIFFFVRSGFTGTSKYVNALWAGDQHVDFSKEYGLPSAIVSSLSLAASGIGVNHSDIGGYTTILHMKRSKELFIRWAELNIFSPIFRCHEGNQPDKNVQFDHDEDVMKHFALLSQAFVALSPYLEHLKDEYQKNGYPIIRPLFYHIDEPWAFEANYTFMFGSEMIVYPIVEEHKLSMSVRLPKGSWVQLFTEMKYLEGVHTVSTPLGLPIAFYRMDSNFRNVFQTEGFLQIGRQFSTMIE